jgi:hypothetical protein
VTSLNCITLFEYIWESGSNLSVSIVVLGQTVPELSILRTSKTGQNCVELLFPCSIADFYIRVMLDALGVRYNPCSTPVYQTRIAPFYPGNNFGSNPTPRGPTLYHFPELEVCVWLGIVVITSQLLSYLAARTFISWTSSHNSGPFPNQPS